MPSLSPSERVLRARIANATALAKHGGYAMTAAARAVSPCTDDYWVARVDATVPASERAERAQYLKKAHFTRLAYLSARARRGRK